ncbi:MAG: peptide chain release factor N(5)-glutamine methyltransferase [Cellvibrionaceae bacterium]|nr:peptide chain release factor N(5)-glutamine methyltransferase [Cellvibrionaceae bacterium]
MTEGVAVSTVEACLSDALHLQALSDSPRLDVELLLCHVLQKDRAYLYTWPEALLSTRQQQCYQKLLARRLAGEPMAYILGEKEFWSLPLQVSSSALIPRPETELLVALALDLSANRSPNPQAAAPLKLLDLGTGTGAIALAFARERPKWQVLAVDKSPDALALARANQDALGITNLRLCHSDWFSALGGQRFDLILANPPYIAPDDPHLTQGDVRYEPRTALVAQEQGLADLRAIIAQAPKFMEKGGCLLLEHGDRQADVVADFLREYGFESCFVRQDLAGHDRVSGAYHNPE